MRDRAAAWGMRLVCLVLLAGSPSSNAEPGGATPPEPGTDWPTVITRLRSEWQNRPGFARIRQQLATAHNNYGVQLAEAGQWEPAKAQLEEALRVDPTSRQVTSNLAAVHLRQAQEHFELRRLPEAQRTVEQALALDGGLAPAHALLGEIAYAQQRLPDAETAWAQAITLDPTLTDVAERLRQVSEELPVESEFGRISQAYFDLRYEEQLERPVGFDVRDALLEARRLVGGDFAMWPKYQIVVLLYGEESFRRLRQETPEWVAGQYDGKIRVPLPGRQLDVPTVKQIIFHEYTHALVHDLGKNRCPVWVNEGLAEYEGARHGPRRLDQLRAAAAGDQLIPWEELNEHFSMDLPAEQVALAYQQSHSIVRYLVERYGFWRIRRILQALAAGQALSDILSSEFHVKLARLEAQWRAWLPKFLAASE